MSDLSFKRRVSIQAVPHRLLSPIAGSSCFQRSLISFLKREQLALDNCNDLFGKQLKLIS